MVSVHSFRSRDSTDLRVVYTPTGSETMASEAEISISAVSVIPNEAWRQSPKGDVFEQCFAHMATYSSFSALSHRVSPNR